MRSIRVLMGVAVVCAAMGTAWAEGLDGRKIHLIAGDVRSVRVPVALPCDASECDKVITVLEPAAAKAVPATLRNGELVFMCDGAMPNTEHDYVVEVAEKDANCAPKVRVEKSAGDCPSQNDALVLDVFIEDAHFTSYHYSNDNRKPFLWPVLSEDGVGVTRDYPMKEGDTPKFAQDHVHHKSLWASYGDLNGADCWGEGDNSGFQHSGEVTWGSGDAYGWIHAKNVWQDKEHQPVIDEEREYRFYATPEKARLLDVHLVFTAAYADVKFGDTKEGGIVSVRMRPELSYKDAVITNALGDEGEAQCWGKPSPWCDCAGEMKDVGWRGLAVFDHPTNLRHPTSWHVRKYGLMGANCFGYSHFSEKDYNKDLIPSNGDYLLKKGETLSFRHRIYVHSGDAKRARVADRYADFATPPKATWSD